MPGPTPDRCVLTGCASGIGRHLAGELLRRGHRVLATDVDGTALERTAAEWPGEPLTATLDVRDANGWRAVLDQAEEAWGGIDGVFNIAGVLRPGEVQSLTPEDVDLHFDINVKGVILGTRAAARRLVVAEAGGHIVNIASIASLAPIPGMSLYSASKYAVRAFSLAAAEELRPHGIAVTAICPDAVATPMFDQQIDFPEAALTFTFPKLLTPEDVTRQILRALRKRPLMVAFPKRRAWLARFADLFPWTQRLIAGRLQKQGIENQRAWKARRDG